MLSPELEKRLHVATWQFINNWNADTPQGHSKLSLVILPRKIKDAFRPLLRQVWREAIEKAVEVCFEIKNNANPRDSHCNCLPLAMERIRALGGKE